MTIRFTTQAIDISTSHGPKSVTAHCAGGLAYHPSVTDPDFYTVTHIASGMCVVSWLTGEEARNAVRAALAAPGADWTKGWDEIRRNPQPYRASKDAMMRAAGMKEE